MVIDVIFGGNGQLVARNDYGTIVMDDAGDQIAAAYLHARDSDAIVGDNGNIFRLVGVSGNDSGSLLAFNYDNYTNDTEQMNIVVRSIQLLDYSEGGTDFTTENEDGEPGIVLGDNGAARCHPR